MTPELPKSIMIATESLQDLVRAGSVELLGNWSWNSMRRMWCCECLLKSNLDSTEYVKQTSRWYVFVSHHYPAGPIDFFPAQIDGLSHTFQHQLLNIEPKIDVPWNLGKICLHDWNFRIGRLGDSSDNYSDIEGRLKLYFFRALYWLEDAALNRLVHVGDQFELPQFLALNNDLVIGFGENEKTYSFWSESEDVSGLLNLSFVNGSSTMMAITGFESAEGKELFSYEWGDSVALGKDIRAGLWFRLDQVPIIEPWKAPMAWGELFNAASRCNFDLKQHLKDLLRLIRDGNPRILSIGFPIPKTIGSYNSLYWWQSLLLPAVSYGAIKGGFRNREQGHIAYDFAHQFTRNARIGWIDSENWSKDQYSSRGVLPDWITQKKVLIIGLGALGSCIAESLVRGGVSDLVVVDAESLEVGNLVRHTLTLADVTKNKAHAIKRRLNSISLHVKVTAIDESFPLSYDERYSEKLDLIQRCTLIIDASANSAVSEAMKHIIFKNETIYLSMWFGYSVKRFYCLSGSGRVYPYHGFQEKSEPCLREEQENIAEVDLPAKYTGCWSATYPARIDDIWLACSVLTKHIASVDDTYFRRPQMAVFEQKTDGAGFKHVSRFE